MTLEKNLSKENLEIMAMFDIEEKEDEKKECSSHLDISALLRTNVNYGNKH